MHFHPPSSLYTSSGKSGHWATNLLLMKVVSHIAHSFKPVSALEERIELLELDG
jgi:hypothetical protein